MKTLRSVLLAFLAAAASAAPTVPAMNADPAQAPSVFDIDSPELAHLGALQVGVRTLQLIDRGQPDLKTFDGATGSVARRDRVLTVDVWYPARLPTGAVRERYAGSLPGEPPAGPFQFTVPGIAVRDAPSTGAGYPLVIVSHGRSNATAAMTWLTENLASKGYVVAAIRHEDPDYSDAAGFLQILHRRPLDIAFVARRLRATLAAEHLIDPDRIALIGYSMGGYGVLTDAGAELDAGAAVLKKIPAGVLEPYCRGGASAGELRIAKLRAVVALAPYGGGTPAVWGTEGLRPVTVPLLLISGDNDRTIDYKSGARALFDSAIHAPRYLLTFKGAGHAIGLNPAPQARPRSLWDLEWFEDPVWKKQRILAINLHFITAFLDRFVKEDEKRADYLDVATAESSEGLWPTPNPLPYEAFSPGQGAITVWKGFQHNRAAGLQLLRAKPGPEVARIAPISGSRAEN